MIFEGSGLTPPENERFPNRLSPSGQNNDHDYHHNDNHYNDYNYYHYSNDIYHHHHYNHHDDGYQASSRSTS